MKQVFLFNFFLLIMASCAPMTEDLSPSTVRITMPKSDHSKRSPSNLRKSRAVTNTSHFSTNDISIIDDIDCYTVVLAFSGDGVCQGDELITQIGIISDTVADGGTIVLDEVPTGEDINFHVIGFNKGQLNSCPSLKDLSLMQIPLMSRPTIVGTTEKELEPIAENNVEINISMNNAKYMNSCGGKPFNWQAGAFGTARFGQVRFGP